VAATPSAQDSLTLRVEIEHRPGMLGRVASAIGEAGETIGAVDLVQVEREHMVRDTTVETGDASDWPRLTAAVDAVAGARVLDTTDRTFLLHVGGKIEIRNKSPLKTRDDSRRRTRRAWRGCAGLFMRIPTRRSSTRSSGTRSRSSRTGPLSSAWATSGPGRRCR
jgi:hypothetical protein